LGAPGSAHVVFGGDFSGAVTHLGGAGADSLTGTSAAETFVSGNGDDTLSGGGGADVFRAGEGDDRIVVGDDLFFRIDGGAGTDTLQLGALDASLNFGMLHANAVRGIEAIDLTGAGNNTLGLGVLDVLNLSDTSNTLRVEGEEGDFVQAVGAVFQGADGGYNVYAFGGAQLRVAEAVAVQTDV
jgi:hypothetical protein